MSYVRHRKRKGTLPSTSQQAADFGSKSSQCEFNRAALLLVCSILHSASAFIIVVFLLIPTQSVSGPTEEESSLEILRFILSATFFSFTAAARDPAMRASNADILP
uniref:Transmembrane protein n=1 Tax=Opuntia streptacantha TaxID=393608 RepID=A0A7C9DJ70_OPUST